MSLESLQRLNAAEVDPAQTLAQLDEHEAARTEETLAVVNADLLHT